MKTSRRLLIAAFAIGALSAVGCKSAPGKPGPEPEVPRPDQVLDFATLYKTNCVACHGDSQHPGAAVSITNPVLLAVIGEDDIKSILDQGVPGKLMPAFGQTGGGMLTEQQVDVLAKGLIATYGNPGVLNGQNPPPFKPTLRPNIEAGQKAFSTYCASCHGANGEGNTDLKQGSIQGSITDQQYLSLISDQELRSYIIAGASGMPDWRSDVPNHALTDQEVTDVVAWLASHRPASAPVSNSPVPDTMPNKTHPLTAEPKHAPSSIR